ncbi:MAG: tRNA (adenosine(37)-N6)-threonylcarbamoyltransferase complex dimerization subunit type 1 TsaB [Desulfovibrio sp.]|jgi:tRNA threonylcarbamoyl adenosine modification protein YeaZ|nr:tRNA (adenosine(37)-N6)-threonylcarbamoyltransferase complex dimerization subunit type 1 TsaB [Desulfovibrio sp.]
MTSRADPPRGRPAIRVPADDSERAGSPGAILVLNTAEGLLQTVLGLPTGGKGWILAGFAEIEAQRQGAETLALLIRDTLARAGLGPGELRRIAAVRGPGGFTGLRLGPVSAAGLARACGALQAGMDYLPLLAQSAIQRLAPELRVPCGPGGIRLWAVVHARRNLVYAQSFTFRASGKALEAGNSAPAGSSGSGDPPGPVGPGAIFSGQRTSVEGMLICPPAQLASLIRADAASLAGSGQRHMVLGSGLEKNREEFSRLLDGGGENSALLPPEYAKPVPEALLAVAASLEYGAADIEPFYARPSDAEENLSTVAASLGIDPGAAKAKLADIATLRRN